MLRARLDDPTVDGDSILIRVDEHARRWWDVAVHTHRPRGDQLICAPPAGDAGPSQKAVQPFQSRRVQSLTVLRVPVSAGGRATPGPSPGVARPPEKTGTRSTV